MTTEPSCNFQYPDDGSESNIDMSAIRLSALEFAARILRESKTKESANLKLECAMSIARVDVSVGRLALEHKVSWNRIEQVLKEIGKLESKLAG